MCHFVIFPIRITTEDKVTSAVIVDKWKGCNITDKLPVVPVGTRNSGQNSKHVVQYC